MNIKTVMEEKYGQIFDYLYSNPKYYYDKEKDTFVVYCALNGIFDTEYELIFEEKSPNEFIKQRILFSTIQKKSKEEKEYFGLFIFEDDSICCLNYDLGKYFVLNRGGYGCDSLDEVGIEFEYLDSFKKELKYFYDILEDDYLKTKIKKLVNPESFSEKRTRDLINIISLD